MQELEEGCYFMETVELGYQSWWAPEGFQVRGKMGIHGKNQGRDICLRNPAWRAVQKAGLGSEFRCF